MSANAKNLSLSLLINLLGLAGIGYQIGTFKGEIAAKVASLEAADVRHERQIEALQKFASVPKPSKVVKDSNPFDAVFVEDDCADVVR